MTFEFKRLDSSNELVSKYLFEKKDDILVEAVLYKYPTYEERTVMCISVMCGCTMGCTFCGTGKFYKRKLTADEIIEQVEIMLYDRQLDATRLKNWQIMTMSMGEPMLNMDALIEALTELNNRYPQAKLLVSTAAPYADYTPFMMLAEEIDQIGLQFSIHESTDEARNSLILNTKKKSLNGIAIQGERFNRLTGRKPFFNYCVHEGNNSYNNMLQLTALFPPMIWEATLSVICESDETMEQAVERQRKLAQDFSDMLASRGYSTRVFNPAGQDDIGGGCGQLWHVQKWAAQNKEILE